MKTSSEYFREDLTVGEAVELEILRIINRKYPKAFKEEGYCPQYDLVIPETNQTVEVKQDFKAKHTDNIVVEFSFDGKPSGISVTTADFWVITDGYWIYWITLENLKKCVDKYGLPSQWKGPGDTKLKGAYLVERDDFIGYCKNPVFRLTGKDPLFRDNFIKRKLKEDQE